MHGSVFHPCPQYLQVLQVLPTPKSKKPTLVSDRHPSPKFGRGHSVCDSKDNRYIRGVTSTYCAVGATEGDSTRLED